MNRRYRTVFWVVLLVINCVLASLAFYMIKWGGDYSAEQKQDSRLIGLSYMTMNNEFYKIMSEEINARIEAEGDRMVMRDPALDPDRQVEQIEEMLEMGIDVLVITPVDTDQIVPVLEKAKQQGAIVVVLDTDAADSEVADCTIRSDNYNAGVIVGKQFLEQHKTGRVVVMTHEAAQSGQDRVQGFLDTVSGVSGIEIVRQVECKGQMEIAMPRMQEVIREETDFDVVFCLNDLSAVGVVAALEENDMLDEVDVYGVDGSPDSKALIKEGMMEATAAQFPTEIGEQAADVIYRLLNGESVEKQILIPVKLITQQNVDEYGTDRWQ